ncbi:MAG: acyl-CoA dehydrogenase family protein, partial [Halobacteria archaeon]|nr:acyl-CoA dehydrogenase family protein [Halobacteria archaeon]
EGAPEGTEGLSLFLVPRIKENGEKNDFVFRRLKDKLGTISVPTGEVELKGAEAYLVGETERGFKYMTEMLNLERLSNAMGSVGLMGRALLESKIHAANREAFGDTIDQYPLMRSDLVDMAVDHEGATAFTFDAAHYFNKREREGDEEAYKLMRILVPIAKHKTGRMGVDTSSYAMEVLGGNGYVNDFVTNRLLRDAQVLPIWEGTSNILSLDVLRAMDRENAHEPLLNVIQDRLDSVEHPLLRDVVNDVRGEYHDLVESLGTVASKGDDYAQLYAKKLANYIFDVYTAALLLKEAQTQIDEENNARKSLVARRFVDNYIRQSEARGIKSGDKIPIEFFDSVVRFKPIKPQLLADSFEADTVEADE